MQANTNSLPLNNFQKERLNWVDQIRGFAVLLVIYAHNFPIVEQYFSNIRIPLFFILAGFFYPKKLDLTTINKKIKTIVIPYFLWATLLFIFWFFIGRKVGASLDYELSPFKNFIGIFYGQGDIYYMDWGMPLWFLPTIFVAFLYFYFIQKYIKKFALQILTILGFVGAGLIYKYYGPDFRLPWSMDIAAVMLFFYAIGYYGFNFIKKIKPSFSFILFIIFFLIHLFCYQENTRVSFYRAQYGEWPWMLFNGLCSSLYIIFFFKALPYFNILSKVGKFSLVALATHGLCLSFIKFICIYILNTDINFSEGQKIINVFIQVLMIYPISIIINKYLPILNGGTKKV